MPELAKLEERDHERGEYAGRRRDGIWRQGVADRVQDYGGESAARQFLRFRGV